MGRLIVKRGFLGLGQPLEKYQCDRCSKECVPCFSEDRHIYCHDCANFVNPNIAHGWWSDERYLSSYSQQFFRDTADGAERLIIQCSHCFSLLAPIRRGQSLQRYYYQIGSTQTTQALVPCIPHGGYDQDGNVAAQTACEHAFVSVGTSKHMDAAALEKHAHMMVNRSRYFEAVFETDEIDIQYECFGTTHYWCARCGLHYSLNPQREHLLPRRGLLAS